MPADHDHAVSHAHDYAALVRSVNERFNAVAGPVFRTDAAGLVGIFLASFTDAAVRRQHSCTCCLRFIEQFGALATVADDGTLLSAIWDPETAPLPYRAITEALRQRVSEARITLLFLSDAPLYGTLASGPWPHLAIVPARITAVGGAHEAARARREALALVLRALRQYSAPVCATALQLLKADPQGNPESVLGQARFLVGLHGARAAASGPQQRDNLAYRMVATAPLRFCRPRACLITSLLDDLEGGMPVAQAAANWNAKMDRNRHEGAPTVAAIKAARSAAAELGVTDALARRFATMADIDQAVWRPHPRYARAERIGVPLRAPIRMTLDAFLRTVLPGAERIEMAALAGRQPFVALTSAVNADAAPITQWDTRERRNPVDWYCYRRGSLAGEFNLSGSFYEVSALILPPWAWTGCGEQQHGERLAFLLKGARDLSACKGHCALFRVKPALRYVIGAFSRGDLLAGAGENNVAGLAVTRGDPCQLSLRVTSKGQVSDYQIDRWD